MTVSPAKGSQHFTSVQQVKEIDESGVLALDNPNLQRLHEPAHSKPKIVTHHDDALHPFAVALPQGLHEISFFLVMLGVEPLLELVEDDHHLLPRLDKSALA